MTNDQLKQTIDKYFQFLKTDDIDPVTLYLDGLANSGKRSMRCLIQNSADIFEFEGPLERMPWPLIQYQHMMKIRTTLQEAGKTANTINLTLSAIRGVMKACFNLGLINADQLMQINEVKRIRGQKLPSGRSLTQSETRELILICKKDKSISGKRDLAIIALMLATGLRRSEVVEIEMEHYNSRSGELLVIAGKGNKQRLLFVPKEIRQLITPWLKCRGRNEGAFFNPIANHTEIKHRKMTSQSIYDLLKKRTNQANIEQCSPHDLRRTFITRLLESGIDINSAKQIAGHSDIKSTVLYDLREEKLRRKSLKNVHLGFGQ